MKRWSSFSFRYIMVKNNLVSRQITRSKILFVLYLGNNMSTNSITQSSNRMISSIFFRMLPVQILIYAMGSINTLVDGAIAGRFIGASTVSVVGLYSSMVSILTATGSVLLGGTSVLCGRFMGRGEHEKTEGIFSLNLLLTFLIGAVITALSFLLPNQIAVVLGANESLLQPLSTYIVGYGIGILPMLLAQQIANFLQMERQSARGYAGIAGMIISNIVLDILFIVVFQMGVFGLALATALSNVVYFLILVPYYFSKKAQLHFSFKKVLWSYAGSMFKIGFPGALLVFCLAIRGIIINRVLLYYSGDDGLAAMSAFNMVAGLFVAYALGNGAVERILISVFLGEEDKSGVRQVLRILMTKGLLLSCAVGALMAVLAPVMSGVFFADHTSNAYVLLVQLFVIYSFCMPMILIIQVMTNYLQAMRHMIMVNIMSVVDGLFSMVVPSLLLAPVLGALGVWVSHPIGIAITIAIVPIYVIIYWRRMPKNLDEWLLFKPGLFVAPENVFALSINSMEDVTHTSEEVQRFCESRHIGRKQAFYSALCLEEMAGNVVRHGFTHDKRSHSAAVRVVRMEESIVLRIRDDCIPFDPEEMRNLVSAEDAVGNIGIRMVYKIADEVNYQNLLGLNVLTITIREQDLGTEQDRDYLLEKTLRSMDKGLHQNFRNTVFIAGRILKRYRILFPEYTDHSEFHSQTVIDSCNRLIGPDQLRKLNKDEIYILLAGCYLHDVGMGISEKDYEEFKDRLGEKEYFEKNPHADRSDFVRDRHNEFSGLFIEKYSDLFEFPSPEHAFAIRQVARGHRKTDLYDEKEYPVKYQLPNGNTVCLPYLAALIRIADEIDVVATRNPLLLYDIGALVDATTEQQLMENKKLHAIRSMRMTRESFILTAMTDEPAVRKSLEEMVKKMQKTLDLCRDVTHKRTSFVMEQEKVVLVFQRK